MVTLYDTTCATARSARACRCPSRTSCASRAKLDLLGVHYIEGGFPGSNPKDIEFFERLGELKLEQAVITAFGLDVPQGHARRGRRGSRLDDRDRLQGAVHLRQGVGHPRHRDAADHAPRERARWCATRWPTSRRRSTPSSSTPSTSSTATRPTATTRSRSCAPRPTRAPTASCSCDTNGGMLPHDDRARSCASCARRVDVPLGIHAHNDSGCAVANSLVAIDAGCVARAGHDATATASAPATPTSSRSSRRSCSRWATTALTADQLRLITEVSHFVAETANISPNPLQPYVGTSAFAHKGGVHASAADAAARGLRARRPRRRRQLRARRRERARRPRVADDEGGRARHRPVGRAGRGRRRARRHQGARVPRLLASRPPTARCRSCCKKRLGTYEPAFQLESFRVIAEKREDGRVATEATIKVHAGGHRYIATAEGNGPVNALDKALRMAIGRFYPRPRRRSSSPTSRSASSRRTRGRPPSPASSSRRRTASARWGTVGVSENIIEASWEALVDSIDYGLTIAAIVDRPPTRPSVRPSSMLAGDGAPSWKPRPQTHHSIGSGVLACASSVCCTRATADTVSLTSRP